MKFCEEYPFVFVSLANLFLSRCKSSCSKGLLCCVPQTSREIIVNERVDERELRYFYENYIPHRFYNCNYYS